MSDGAELLIRVSGWFPVLTGDGSVRTVTLDQIIEYGDRVFSPEPVTAEQVRHYLLEDFRQGLTSLDGHVWQAEPGSWLAGALEV